MKDSATRRAWVKNVAIIFLVILLLLTFFSRTIISKLASLSSIAMER